MGTRFGSGAARLIAVLIITSLCVGPAAGASPAGTAADEPGSAAPVSAAPVSATLPASAVAAGARRTVEPAATTVRIAYLHHSTGGVVWDGGVPAFISKWNRDHGKRYRITALTYPNTNGGYPWHNYPYDYWNLWVRHKGSKGDRGERTLDQLAATYKVIVFKHCFPVSEVLPKGTVAARVSSPIKTIANYKLQYLALRKRMHQFPKVKFIVWTGAALTRQSTTAGNANRARTFFRWVIEDWDDKGDNIFVWDFRKLETNGGLYLLPEHAAAPDDSHPNAEFAAEVAPLIGRRIVDVIEGRGDKRSRTGR